MLRQLFELRRGLNKAWYIVGQHRDMFSILTRRAEDLITHHAVLEYYLRDVNDHLIRIGDITAVQRDNLHNIIDLYVSAQSNRLNIVVNRLAIITILIGILTVISGFYGMNFEHTWPPFSAPWGVPFVLAVMLGLVAGVMALFKWLDLY
jgi:magnesium transporter